MVRANLEGQNSLFFLLIHLKIILNFKVLKYFRPRIPTTAKDKKDEIYSLSMMKSPHIPSAVQSGRQEAMGLTLDGNSEHEVHA